MNRSRDMNDFVRQAYDAIGDAYLEVRRGDTHDVPHLEALTRRVRPGGRILDVGCGPGIPIASYLVDAGFQVLGIDISREQVRLARENVPNGEFTVRDMSKLTAGEFEVDAVVAFYSLFHTPRDDHPALLSVLRTFVHRGGWLLCTSGSTEWEGEEPFLGTPMRWSHHGPEEWIRLIEATGFRTGSARMVEHRFDVTLERHLVVLAEAC